MITEAYPPMGKSIKMLAKQVIEQGKPCNIEFGTVVSSSPLIIRLSQKIELNDKFLILTNAVKDHSVDITVSWKTVENKHKHGNGNDGQPTDEVEHDHGISGVKKITIHNGLTVGEKVILLRVQGGQSYVVIDRVDEIPKFKGESI
jgi:hypothetical protein